MQPPRAFALRQLLLAIAVALVATPGECLDDPNLPVIFYPFGTDQWDSVAPVNDDGFTPAVQIGLGFPFFSSRRTAVFVSIATDRVITLYAYQ